ncbi:MAG: hypothetical protein IT204_25475 [Fimbriimonadaceae bacterium]|nr:hypothetical protein [Fimbriimonadaceae bacterium]
MRLRAWIERWAARLLRYRGQQGVVRLPGRCPACGAETALTTCEARQWLCFGPLPVCPLRAWRLFDQCPVCLHQHRIGRAEYRVWSDQEAAPAVAALAARPQDAAARWELASTWFRLGRLPETWATLAPVTAAGQANAAQWHLCAEVLTALGRPGEAFEAYRQAAELEPGGAAYRRDLGRELSRRRGQLALAEHHLEAAVAAAPADLEAWLLLATVRHRRGAASTALAAWQAAARLDPGGVRLAPYRRQIKICEARLRAA